MFDSNFQGTIIRNEPAFRPRPAAMLGYHKFSHGRFDAFVALRALDHIAREARRAAPNETIGYLAGRPFRDAQGPYAIVTDAITATSARCGPVTVETSLDDERQLLDTLAAEHPLAEKLGWFHSHPFMMPYYSGTDKENQRFWNEPFHLGLLAALNNEDNTVMIYAFRGPESEPAQPAYTAVDTHFEPVPAFRPLPHTAMGEPTTHEWNRKQRAIRRRANPIMLTLALCVVWPIVCLIGVWMIVQAMREGPRRAAPALQAAETTAKTEPVDPPAARAPAASRK